MADNVIKGKNDFKIKPGTTEILGSTSQKMKMDPNFSEPKTMSSNTNIKGAPSVSKGSMSVANELTGQKGFPQYSNIVKNPPAQPKQTGRDGFISSQSMPRTDIKGSVKL